MNTFCTIITSDFAYYIIAQYRSYRRFCEIPLKVLCIDHKQDIAVHYDIPEGMSLYYLDELPNNHTSTSLIEKYHRSPDLLRWSLKSVWMLHLVESGSAENVIFIDPDLYFFDNPAFLFETLSTQAMLLSPHWRSTDPEKDPANFEMNFRDGIYNGGFLGATIKGKKALQWLASACLYKCEVTPERGLFVDQKYLDLLQSRFPDVVSLSHKGCNVANWNQVDCQRMLVDGQVRINGTEQIVFIHFTKSTILGIRHGSDALLAPFLLEYQNALRIVNPAHEGPVLSATRKRKHGKSSIQQSISKLISGRKRKSS